VTHAERAGQAVDILRAGRGADLLMVDVNIDIAGLIAQLKSEHIHLPVVACGTGTDAKAAVNAIQAGALRKEVASLKIKLANAQSRLDSLRERIDEMRKNSSDAERLRGNAGKLREQAKNLLEDMSPAERERLADWLRSEQAERGNAQPFDTEDLDARAARKLDSPVGFRMRERHAGRQHER